MEQTLSQHCETVLIFDLGYISNANRAFYAEKKLHGNKKPHILKPTIF